MDQGSNSHKTHRDSSASYQPPGIIQSISDVGGQLLWDFVETAVIVLAICVVIYLFVARPHLVLGSSMETNFHDGEYLLTNQFSYRFGDPKRGDVVIFKHSETQDYIKRIIGLPGETVAIREGKVYIDESALSEPYLDSGTITQYGSFLSNAGDSVTLAEDEYFVLGDNRPQSSDSRTFGVLKRSDIKGKAWIVYWPLDDFKFVKGPAYELP